jgi:nucleoside-diphosphate-sugar epimerase
MKLLRWTGPGGSRHAAALFGVGLLGGAIEEALRGEAQADTAVMPYDWGDAAARAAQLLDIERAILDGAEPEGPRSIDLIWAGGRSGFGSSVDDMQTEEAIFAQILAFGATLEARAPDAAHGFHMISSAGGLFEGVSHCGADTPPRPLRPYGSGKLRQEALVHASGGKALRRIYRPSSVYGFRPGGRLGLVTALASNALTGRTTRIVGSPHTIRDYVSTEDIGHFVAQEALRRSPGADLTFLLASGRPAAMCEMIALVEQAVQARTLLQYDPNPSNALNMSFRPSALPRRWRPTALETGIRRTVSQVRRAVLHQC